MDEFIEFKEWFDKNWDLDTKEKFEELKSKYNNSTDDNEKEKIKKQMKDIIANQYGYYVFGIANEDNSPEQRLSKLLSSYINSEKPEKSRKKSNAPINDANIIEWLIECVHNHIFDYEDTSELNNKLINRLKHECLLIENEKTHKITKINYPKAKKFVKKYEEKNNIKLNDEIHSLLEKLIEEEVKEFIDNLEKDNEIIVVELQKRFKIKKYEAENLIDKIIPKKEKEIKENIAPKKEDNVIERLLKSEYGLFNYPILDKPVKKETQKEDKVALIISRISQSGNPDSEIEKLSDEELELLFNCTMLEDSDKYTTSLSELNWRKILEKVFELKYDIIEKNLNSINVLYDILLDNYKEMKQINLQFKKIPLNQEKYNKLQKIFRDNFENIYKTLNNIDVMQEELFEILNPNINSKLLSYAWNNIVKSKLETYGKNDEKLMEFNELLENHLRYSLNIKDTETYLDELFNNKDIFNDVSNYDKIISVIEGIIFREKINNNYFLENENKITVGVNENETASYLHVHEEYLKRLNDWQKDSPLFRVKELSELDVAIDELEKQKRL